MGGVSKLLLFSEFKDRNGGDGGWAWRNDSVGVAWAWRQQLSIKGKQAKSSHFLSKKVKETFFLLFFLLTLLVFFWPEHLTLWKKFTLFFRTFYLSFFFFGLLRLHFSIGLKSLFFLSRMDIVLNRSVHKIFF